MVYRADAVGRENRFHSDTLSLGYTLRVSLYDHSVIYKDKPRSGSKLGGASLRTGGLMTVFMEICFPFRG